MSNPNEIGTLQKIMVKPSAWELHHSGDVYWLRFTYDDPAKNPSWSEVVTRRGGRKEYKTADAALADIGKVSDFSLIFHMRANILD